MAAEGDGKGSRRWLFGPGIDLTLGCGLGYALVLPLLAWGGAGLLTPGFVACIPLISLVAGTPHYGATLLRVYEHREDRRSYRFFTVWATLLVFVFFAVAVHERTVASWLFTLYITWSPWHYTGQNYGLGVMFLRRRGVPVSPAAKRLLYFSFLSSFLITLLALHGSDASYNPNNISDDQTSLQRSLGIPYAITQVLLPLAVLAHVGCAIAAAVLLRRGARWRDLGPTAALLASQALWFSIPFAVGFWRFETGVAPFDHLGAYVFATATAHGLQYLWVTTYYARADGRTWRGVGPYLWKALAAGAAVWTLPALLFAPGALGNMEYTAGLSLLVAAAVNIHHFILDGAIWKLRSSRIAGVLIRADASVGRPEPIVPSSSGVWLRRGVWAACGLAVLVSLSGRVLEPVFHHALRSGDALRAARALDGLAWIGRDSAVNRLRVGHALLREDALDEARAQFERALTLAPGDETRASLAAVHARLGGRAREAGDAPRAVRHYRESLRLDPGRASAANNLAWILATTSDPELRDPAEAIRLVGDALRADAAPDPNYLDTLAVAYAAALRFDDAVETAERALELADRRGDRALGDAIRSRRRLFEQGRSYGDPAPVPVP